MVAGIATPVIAQEGGRITLGHARILTNDSIVDRQDRWRTGSYTMSVIRGREWTGRPPERLGELLEFRFHGEAIAPRAISVPVAPGDRRPVGVIGLGLHSHISRGAADIRLGADLVAIGPQTGVLSFQDRLHAIFGYPRSAIQGDQLGNAFHPTLGAEIGREAVFAEGIRIRPFLEAQAGAETFVRAGIDMVVGSYGEAALMVRDPVSGHRVRSVQTAPGGGVSVVMGADVARVLSSAYLPPALGPGPEPFRSRARLGVVAHGARSEVFYGLSWLGREFRGQRDGQVVGTVSLRMRF
ncbi:MAG: DUF2219 family protein [Rhodobacteraceae bacterium]|nr:DUF2219 family protein [Paracoccaceae bacterium]